MAHPKSSSMFFVTNEKEDAMLREINWQYLNAPTIAQRDLVLSIAAVSHDYGKMREYIPGLSYSKYYRARKVNTNSGSHNKTQQVGLSHKSLPEKSKTLERFSPAKLELFVSYLTW